MIKKFMTLFMVVAIFTVQAHAASQQGLKAAFDEMNYSLTVEWDQKDKGFYEGQLKKFSASVRELQKQGLTNQQMIEFAQSQVKDKKIAKDLETAFSMVTINKMNSEEASKYMMDSMKRAYSNGASWNGDVLLYLGVGLLIVVLAVALANGNVAVGGGSYQPGYSCYDTNCYYYDYRCGYDSWGPIYCESYTCDEVCY